MGTTPMTTIPWSSLRTDKIPIKDLDLSTIPHGTLTSSLKLAAECFKGDQSAIGNEIMDTVCKYMESGGFDERNYSHLNHLLDGPRCELARLKFTMGYLWTRVNTFHDREQIALRVVEYLRKVPINGFGRCISGYSMQTFERPASSMGRK